MRSFVAEHLDGLRLIQVPVEMDHESLPAVAAALPSRPT